MARAVERTLFLQLDQPVDLQTTLESGQVFLWQSDGASWLGVIGGEVVALAETEGGLLVRSTAPPEEARLAVSRFLRLDDDLTEVYRHFSGDTHLVDGASRYRGLRVLRQDPWECLASFICSQVSNIPRITRNLASLAYALGDPVEMGGRRLYSFPPAERVAQAGEAHLRRLGLGFRAAYLTHAARSVTSGHTDLAALRWETYEASRAALVQLGGVGEKIADCVLLFSLEKTEAFPVDRWVRRALQEFYRHSRKASYADMGAWARRRWGPYAGYAQQYLYQYRWLLNRPSGR